MKKNIQPLVFFTPSQERPTGLPLANSAVSAGFPSPADDFKELRISLDQEVVKNKEPEDNAIAVCFIEGEFTVKRLKVEASCIYLMPENPNYKPIKVTEDQQLIIWGVVTYVVKKI